MGVLGKTCSFFLFFLEWFLVCGMRVDIGPLLLILLHHIGLFVGIFLAQKRKGRDKERGGLQEEKNAKEGVEI